MTLKREALTLLAKGLALILLIFFVLLPSLYPFTFVIINWGEIYREVFANPYIGSQYLYEIERSLFLSLRLALTALLVDLIVGIPLAYILARKEFKGKSILENIITLPLVVPTSGFGFAMLMAWTASESPVALLGWRIRVDQVIPIVEVPLLALLVHVALTFPYIVKTVSAAISDINKAFEIVSSSLGAKQVTTFRKITLPLALPGIISGSVLALARSLGETGATLIVIGVSTTASIAIVRWEFENKIAPAALLGAVLVIMAVALIIPAERLASRKIRKSIYFFKPIDEFLIKLERRIPKGSGLLLDLTTIVFLTVIIVLPIFILVNNTLLYWSKDPYTGRWEGSVLYQLFGPPNYYASISKSLLTSIIVSTLATILSLYIAILTVLLIVKSKYGKVVRSLLKVPLVAPTSALGLSMILLWGPKGLNVLTPGIWLIVFTHIVFSVPVIVETALASYTSIGIEFYEETARTLGANPYTVYETISIPMIKRGLIAGGILAFTHSLGETGATFLVCGRDLTVSTLVVSMVESLAIPAALFASTLLLAVALILIVIVNYLEKIE